MNEQVDFYLKQAQAGFSKNAWLLRMQEEARLNFTEAGFPVRSDEDWKYTSLVDFLQHQFVAHGEVSPTQAPDSRTIPVKSHRFSIENGRLLGDTSCFPAGVVILPLLEALETFPEKVTPYLGQILKSTHAFHEMNTLMLQLGLLIYIPKNVCIEEPVWLSHWQSTANHAVFLRHLVILEAGSQLNLIEDYSGDDLACYFTNSITEIRLGPSAKLTHAKIQREGKLAYHVGDLAVKQEAQSQFNSHLLNIGGAWVRSDMTIHLTEPLASCSLNGIYAPGEGQHIENHTLVEHEVPDCHSFQDYKGILKGHSRAVFNGRVVVAPNAQHTKAEQQNKNLLLSNHAEIDTKPQLEIFADDVICTHGATVGQLDEDALFYFTTRGIGREEASRLLVRAFMTANLRLIHDEKLAAWVEQLLNDQLG